MADKVKPVNIARKSDDSTASVADLLVVEEPLEIRVGYGSEDSRMQHSLTVTMRTPDDDEHLCLGFLYSEGIITSQDEVLSAKYCTNIKDEDGGDNVMRVELNPGIEYKPADFKRNFYTTSSCGVCGKASIAQVHTDCSPLTSEAIVRYDIIRNLPETLLVSQDIFKHTGGVHACGIFDLQGNILMHKEDVGRHNALDKLIGALLIKRELPAENKMLMLSGRISFELVQKSIKAGIAIVAAVGAPSSLAVSLADDFGVTLIGFVKETGFNIYTNQHRIIG